MKTINGVIKFVVGSSLTLALAVGVCLPVQTQAADQVKGGQKLTELNRIKTAEDTATIQPGDLVVMSCPKCQTVLVTSVDKDAKGGQLLASNGAATKSTAKHLCPGCETTFTRKGAGKQGKDEIIHVCQKCGSQEAFCCVLKKGSPATKGMEKK